MNKTIIININGLIFHIEEDAYAVLQNYMVNVKKHFGYSIDSEEIVGDIENRIAEMFNERLTEQKAVIDMEDVREVCAQMGSVEDFEINEETDSEYASVDADTFQVKRSLFRDPDNKVFGGVCSGLGHYFDIDAKWVRIIFLLIFFFGGTGLLVYIILWIAVPLAKSRADKLRMRGESPNLENFKRSFQEEMGDVKRSFSVASRRAQRSIDNPDSTFNSIIEGIGKVAIVFIKFIGVILIFALSMSLISMIIALFIGIGAWDTAYVSYDFPLFMIEDSMRTSLSVALFFIMAIPLLLLILLAIRLLFNKKILGRYFGFSLLIVWLVALGLSIFYISKTVVDFSEEATIRREITLSPQEYYRLDLREDDKFLGKGGELDSLGEQKVRTRSFNSTRRYFSNKDKRVTLEINPTDANQAAFLIEELSAKGKNFESAVERAGRIDFSVKQANERLWLDDPAILPKGEVFRDQEVSIKLYIPVGTRLFLPRDIDRKVRIRGFSLWECSDSDSDRRNFNDTEWIMTEGGLKCLASSSALTDPQSADTLMTDSIQR